MTSSTSTGFTPPSPPPSTAGRVVAAVAIALLYGVAASPLGDGRVLLVLGAVLIISAAFIALSARRKGFRTNTYSPMRADPETPTVLGGAVAPSTEKSPETRARNLMSFAAPALFLAAWIGQQVTTVTLSWIWTGAVVVLALVVMGRIFVLEAGSAPGYAPLTTVFGGEPDWRPTDDVDAVASVLYATHAVPSGRQFRRETLGDLMEAFFERPERSERIDTAMQALVRRGQAVVLCDRRDADTVHVWVTLTDEGREAVKAGAVTAR